MDGLRIFRPTSSCFSHDHHWRAVSAFFTLKVKEKQDDKRKGEDRGVCWAFGLSPYDSTAV